MSIRRKSTTHDLATLRLHPDGSRVQQSSVNARQRTASSTLVDHRGNWIAKDAGGQSSVKTRRSVSIPTHDAEGEFINLSGDEDDGNRSRSQRKGKQRARVSQSLEVDPSGEREPPHLNTRTKRRLSFMRDFSFLDSPPASVSSQDPEHPDDASGQDSPAISFSYPAPDLLKSIHHFASCYYRERGELFDGSRNYRGRRKERRKQSQENLHTLTARGPNLDSEEEEVDDELTEEDEDEDEDMENENENGSREGPRTDSGRKDMYKALDGSALMAIGIVLQEYVAHALLSRPSKRRRIESTSRDSRSEHAE